MSRVAERMMSSIEEHAFAEAAGYTDGAWLALARDGRLKETLLDEGVRMRWAAARRKSPRRSPARIRPVLLVSLYDRRAWRMVDLAFRSPMRRLA